MKLTLPTEFIEKRNYYDRCPLHIANNIRIGNAPDSMYYGLEIEMDIKPYRYENYAYISDMRVMLKSKTQIPEFIYLQTDCSIDDSVEATTVPCSWSFLTSSATKSILSRWLKQCLSLGFISSNRAGLHIHMSKNGFQDIEHMYRFCWFIYHNVRFSKRIGRRVKENFSHYYKYFKDKEILSNSLHALHNSAPFDKHYEWQNQFYATPYHIRYTTANYAVKEHKMAFSGKDCAVNFNNSNTIEVRMFRGIISYSHIYSSLEFCKSLLEFSKIYTNEDEMTVKRFKQYIFNNRKKYPNLLKGLMYKRKAI